VTNGMDNPILNSPLAQPDRRFVIGPRGPAGEIREGRRPSESFILIALTKEGSRGSVGAEQVEIDFDATGEWREKNTLINELRREVARWRLGRSTPASLRPLESLISGSGGRSP
jgi:type III restriction enzyme